MLDPSRRDKANRGARGPLPVVMLLAAVARACACAWAAAGCSILESFPDYPADASLPRPPVDGTAPVVDSSSPPDTQVVVVPDAGTEAGVCGPDAMSCTCVPATKRCAGGGLETCDGTGKWGPPIPCGGATPFCSTNACAPNPPSCATGGAGLSNCGASSQSCCTSPEVPAGPYNRTYMNSGSGATGQADPASVSAFRLDRYEVTVGRYRQFVGALNAPGGWTPAPASGKHAHLNAGKGLADSANPGMYEPGWLATDDAQIPSSPSICDPSYASWTPAAGQNESLPINCVSWYEAYAFCIWDGGFLPSDAEREYAAAGGSEARQYPWGTATPGMGSSYAIYGCFYPDPTKTCTGFANLAPVGTATLGEGPYHQMDLVGEVAEWSLDWATSYVDPCVDCAYLAQPMPTDGAAAARALRGGLYDWVLAESPTRETVAPTTRISFVGFRCARSP